MSIEFYRAVHFIAIFAVIFLSGINLLSDKKSKVTKVLSAVCGVLILVAGMGLMAKMGYGKEGGWPHWIIAKIVIWLGVLSSGMFVAKRVAADKKAHFYGFMVFLLMAAALLGVFRP